jgi:putative Holliday junction resolvase
MTTIVSIESFADLEPGRRLLGLDLGTKTIGLALSDVRRVVATPLETIQRTKFTKDAARLIAICTKHAIGGLVVGLPLNMDGSEGPRAQATRAFIRNLGPHLDLPVVLWDERLTTVAVNRAMIAADTSRARRAEVVDKVAAGYILQGVLDRLSELDRSSHNPAQND